MPVTLAPSNVMPVVTSPPPLTTESGTAFVDPVAVKAAAPRPYRGVLAPEAAGVVAQPSLLTQLEALGERLEAMKKPAEPETAPPPVDEPSDTSMLPVPWMNSTYDTCAAYAGEAARVASTGRLPFGSDSKKMAV